MLQGIKFHKKYLVWILENADSDTYVKICALAGEEINFENTPPFGIFALRLSKTGMCWAVTAYWCRSWSGKL